MNGPDTTTSLFLPFLFSGVRPFVFLGKITNTNIRNRIEYYLKLNQTFYMSTKQRKLNFDTITSLGCSDNAIVFFETSVCLMSDNMKANKINLVLR